MCTLRSVSAAAILLVCSLICVVRPTVAAEPPKSTLHIIVASDTAACGIDNTIVLHVPAHGWDATGDHRLHVAIEDRMPSVLSIESPTRDGDRMLLRLRPSDCKAETGQRLNIWIDAAKNGQSRDRISSNRVSLFVGTSIQLYNALAQTLNAEAKTIEETIKSVQALRTDVQALRSSPSTDAQVKRVAGSMQASSDVFVQLKKCHWQLATWHPIVSQGRQSNELNDKFTKLLDGLDATEHAKEYSARVESLRAAENDTQRQAAIVAAEASLGQLETDLTQTLSSLHKMSSYCEAVALLQEILDKQRGLQGEERFRGVRDLLK